MRMIRRFRVSIARRGARIGTANRRRPRDRRFTGRSKCRCRLLTCRAVIVRSLTLRVLATAAITVSFTVSMGTPGFAFPLAARLVAAAA